MCQVLSFWRCPAVIAARNEITDEYKTMILKFCQIMRSKEFGLHDAASYLESWVCGTMIVAPLIDCSAPLVTCGILFLLIAFLFAAFRMRFQFASFPKFYTGVCRCRLGDRFQVPAAIPVANQATSWFIHQNPLRLLV